MYSGCGGSGATNGDPVPRNGPGRSKTRTSTLIGRSSWHPPLTSGEWGASAGKPCHTKLGSMSPALTGEKEMPTTSGGSVECAREPEPSPGIEARGGRRTFWHTTMGNEEIIYYRHFRFQLPERSLHREWQYLYVSPTRWNCIRPGTSPAYLGWFNVGPVA